MVREVLRRRSVTKAVQSIMMVAVLNARMQVLASHASDNRDSSSSDTSSVHAMFTSSTESDDRDSSKTVAVYITCLLFIPAAIS